MDGGSSLPTIKCSTCGVAIDILQLADHVCATAAPIENTMSPKRDRAGTLGGASFNNRSDGQSRPGRMPPPAKIDSHAANKPFRVQDPSPMSSYSDQNSNSPYSSGNGRFQMNRSATSPIPQSYASQSPGLSSNNDSAFPPFPTRRNDTPTNTKPDPGQWPEPSYAQQYLQPSPLFAPVSPRTNGGESVVRRMDTIAPGPFDGRGSDRRPSTASGAGDDSRPFGHKRTNTQSSVRSNGGMGRPPNERTSQVSTASRGSNFSNGGNSLPSRPRPGMGGSAGMPPPPPPPPPKEEGIDAFLQRLQKETMGPSRKDQDGRSRTYPLRQESREATDPSAKQMESRRNPRYPTVTDSPGSAARSNNTFPARSSSRGGSKATILREDLPPLPPVPNYARDFPSDAIHTPSDSGLSEDSWASSGFRSAASSRSSPPTSEVGNSRSGSKISRPDYDDGPMLRTYSPESFIEPRPSPPIPGGHKPNASYSYNRTREPEPVLQPPRAPYSPLESPLDPAIQFGLSSERRKEERRQLRDPALNMPSSTSRTADPERRPTAKRRPTALANKGKCRGCSELITGKSVKDSSGRLTGRYHKECFVCRTCGDPFPTAEFYVFENFPYCERHYHELNDSICRSCDRGIEGQYLETDQRLKFHPKCFTCSTCRIVLRDDYYEIGGRNYCERHAYSVANQQNQSLGVGRNKSQTLQRRRTRMMMMI